jgi:hypothetical protein
MQLLKVQAIYWFMHQIWLFTMEQHKLQKKILNPNSEYLKNLRNSLRTYEEAVKYLPNQVYIGNKTPVDLKSVPQPWVDKPVEDATRNGKFGEIMPEDEFIGLMKIVDVFDLVKLSKEFTKIVKEKLSNHPLISDELVSRLKDGEELNDINKLINEQEAEPLYLDNNIVGCVKKSP